MNFLKKHYEKVLLGTVLFGLLAAVVLLLFAIDQEKQSMEEQRQTILARRIQPLPPLDTNAFVLAEHRCEIPLTLNFSAPPHNLINPVRWIKSPEGVWSKATPAQQVGPERIQVTKITPLYRTISYEAYNPAGSNYTIRVETDFGRGQHRGSSRYVQLHEKTPAFTLRAVQGPPTNPTVLELQLNDTGDQVSIATNKPYRKIEGYTVDLKYDLERHRPWVNERVGSKLLLAGDEFTILSINLVATHQYEVVLSAKSTGKKTTIEYNAAP